MHLNKQDGKSELAFIGVSDKDSRKVIILVANVLGIMARKDGYVMEHRLVMAKHLNKILQRIEVVHHKDHNTRNNAIENLELFPDNRTHKLIEWERVKNAMALKDLKVTELL